MVIQVLLGLLAWALVCGPLLLLWWLSRQGEHVEFRELEDRQPCYSGDATPRNLGPMS